MIIEFHKSLVLVILCLNNVVKKQEESVKGSRESHHPHVLQWLGYKALNTTFVQSWCFCTTPFYHNLCTQKERG